MKLRHVIVVGGGASGIVAAITAAREGARVTLVEQKDRIGKKILSTGNGRCNLTNEYMENSCFRGDNTEIVNEVLSQFGYHDTVRFFEELGVMLKNRQGYIYPLSDQASTILDVLRMEIEHLKIQILLEASVTDIFATTSGFSVKTTVKNLKADAVVLATGGKASSVLGSDGSGYTLAKQFGHHLSPVTPALVQLKCKGNFFKQISGVRTQAEVKLLVNNKLVASDTGELQLTNYGISGIPVFQVSRYASKALYAKESVSAEIDFLPMLEEKVWTEFIENRRKLHAHKTAEEFLTGIFHKKLIGMFLKQAQISPTKNISEISNKHWSDLLTLCKHFKVIVEDTNSFEQAQVCAGGVKTCEINPHTMESLYQENLYLTGELLDIDGICGGYNLQWAWATGYIAGSHAAKGHLYASNQPVKTSTKS